MQKFKIQVKNCRRKKFFRVKSTFFQKKSHILSTLARKLLLCWQEPKSSGLIKKKLRCNFRFQQRSGSIISRRKHKFLNSFFMRGDKLLFQRSPLCFTGQRVYGVFHPPDGYVSMNEIMRVEPSTRRGCRKKPVRLAEK